MKHFSWWIWVRALRCSAEYFSTAPNRTDGGISRRINPCLRTVRCSRQTAITQTFLYTSSHTSFLWYGVDEVRGLLRVKGSVPEASAFSVAAQRIQLKYHRRDPRSQQQDLISLNFCLPTAQLLLASAL